MEWKEYGPYLTHCFWVCGEFRPSQEGVKVINFSLSVCNIVGARNTRLLSADVRLLGILLGSFFSPVILFIYKFLHFFISGKIILVHESGWDNTPLSSMIYNGSDIWEGRAVFSLKFILEFHLMKDLNYGWLTKLKKNS